MDTLIYSGMDEHEEWSKTSAEIFTFHTCVISMDNLTIDMSQGDIEFFDSYYQTGYHLQFTLLLTFEMIDALYFVNLLG